MGGLSHYDEQWRDWPKDRGPINWRSAHHDEPHPAVVELFDITEEHGMTVELAVSGGQPLGGSGKEYRRLSLLSVCLGDRTLTNADAGALTLQMAASACTQRLKRHL